MTWLQRLKERLKAARGADIHSRRTDETDRTPGFVSFVSPTQADIPSSEEKECDPAADDAREAFEERAAIMEYDGGLSREQAERQATRSADGIKRAREADPAGSEVLRSSESKVGTDRFERRSWRGEGLDLGDLRPCLWCRNLTLSGRCLAQWRGEMHGARDWAPPIPGLARRCIGYKPPADDPDQRPGRERWPELIEWQGPRNGPKVGGDIAPKKRNGS